ncbi:MAG TPA: hypothetical protein VJ521_12210, partial [Acidobacteriota bacterium]|nr:hypothetical protein [Acidobacteriota bacterium]
MKNQKTLSLGVFMLVIGLLLPAPSTADPQKEREEAIKRQLYEQANRDEAIQRVVAKLKKDPKNQSLIDELLMRLPISPL